MKRVLSIVPFDPIYPPMNGGMQRCFHIINQLAIHTDLTIIINQEKENFLLAVNEYPAVKGVTVYSNLDVPKPKDIFRLLPAKPEQALRYRWYKRKIRGAADGNFLKYYYLVKRSLKEKKFDVVILESPATLNAVSLIRRYDKKVRIIFDAHNVETNLAAAFLANKQVSSERLLSARKAESTLYKTVDAILACSKKDQDDFDRLNNGKLSISVIPNGVTVGEEKYDAGVVSDNTAYILFCGFLSTRPNSEGLLWFHTSIWPRVKNAFPQLKLLVLGSGSLPAGMEEIRNDESLVFTGGVEDVRPYYNKSTLSIVPLKTGSGTRLKILEAMSYGLPVVSTGQGAEGIEYTNGLNILIADNEDCFSESVIQLLKDKGKRIAMRDSARELVATKYDWNLIGKSLADFINGGDDFPNL